MRKFFIVLLLLLNLSILSGAALSDVASAGLEAGKPTVLITGANRGIGLEFVRQYSALDWNIIATASNLKKAKELKALADADRKCPMRSNRPKASRKLSRSSTG